MTANIYPDAYYILSEKIEERGVSMEKNVGDLDSFLRIGLGITLAGMGIMRRSMPLLAFGGFKVAEGITRFCPMLYVMGASTAKMVDKAEHAVKAVEEIKEALQ